MKLSSRDCREGSESDVSFVAITRIFATDCSFHWNRYLTGVYRECSFNIEEISILPLFPILPMTSGSDRLVSRLVKAQLYYDAIRHSSHR